MVLLCTPRAASKPFVRRERGREGREEKVRERERGKERGGQFGDNKTR